MGFLRLPDDRNDTFGSYAFTVFRTMKPWLARELAVAVPARVSATPFSAFLPSATAPDAIAKLVPTGPAANGMNRDYRRLPGRSGSRFYPTSGFIG